MKNQITKTDITKNSSFFWIYYFSCFRGFDDEKELNIDDALKDVVDIDFEELQQWSQTFFNPSTEELKFIGGQLSENLSFQIDFYEDEITYFINDEYIGNLSGHFEAWSLTLEEIGYFQKHDFLFLLLLPMVGISKEDFKEAKDLIRKNIEELPTFKNQSAYLAKCITNGLVMNGNFYKDEIYGTVNNQNHSVRNIEKYPEYSESVLRLNKALRTL